MVSLIAIGLLAGEVIRPVAEPVPSLSDAAVLYGLNGFQSMNPAVVGRPEYRANLRAMSPRWFRVHHAGLAGDSKTTDAGWWDTAGGTWDSAKIAGSLGRLPVQADSIVLNISHWPADQAEDPPGLLASAEIPRFAQRCADLVRIVNRDLKLGVRWWEVTNERDVPAFVDVQGPDRVDQLARTWVEAARAMKRVDPSIRVGGPAAARPDKVEFARKFVRRTAPDLDFYSLHAYASGSAEDSDAEVFARAGAIGSMLRDTVRAVREIRGERFPVFLDEYNISWTWETRDPRMTNVSSAVFDALVMASSLDSGTAGLFAWNERDGVYGKSDGDDQMRPSGRMFAELNRVATGPARTLRNTGPIRGWVTPGAIVLVNPTPDAVTVDQRSLGRASSVWMASSAGWTSHRAAALYLKGPDVAILRRG